MTALQQQALSLYRRLLRAARQWKGPAEEAAYIRQEARQQFRANQHNPSSQEVTKSLDYGEKRLELALHYGIAYERLHHADQFEKVPYVHKPQLESDPEAVASTVRDKDVAAKLAAAARRRKQRLDQQQQQQQQQAPGDGTQ